MAFSKGVTSFDLNLKSITLVAVWRIDGRWQGQNLGGQLQEAMAIFQMRDHGGLITFFFLFGEPVFSPCQPLYQVQISLS